ncbi:MAG: ABC transporter ATP-binding protein [Alphaproteobacteria bacterium]|jgi:phosphate-transporting ATPase|nr:ABC transporter ATP-binding protein [Alphaproteobacteria bacterium]MDP6563468.1 ABC transporter ATP-binding protein [Alphaproteobacteria bacterium]MDP6815653.1 ABC transporter ATP-binding protein [Alphaproteobacteria bacterium]
MLCVEGLQRPGLGPISLHIDDGECLALMGPSGAGKTLLLRAIADLDPNTGRAAAAGQARADTPAPDWRRLVAYLPAEPGWWADGVAEHFADRPAALPLLAALGLDAGCLEWAVARASTGERQRLALARGLAGDPAVLLLDEPTAALDPDAAVAVEELIRQRQQAGVSVLLVTHRAEQAERLASRTLHIRAGRLVEGGGS